MPRPASGSVIAKKTKSGVTSYAIRFRVPGRGREYLHLGYSPEWSHRKAEQELARVQADIARGLWHSPEEVYASQREAPSFHVFASEWIAGREQEGLRPRTLEYFAWTLTNHLLPFFADDPVDRITVERVDRYSRAKRTEGRLSAGSINKTLETLSAIMEVAVEYGYAPSNPAKGRRRRLKVTKPKRPFLEPNQVAALLMAAGECDAEDRSNRRFRRPLLSVLAYAGLRIGELLSLRWSDVNLAAARLRVRESKTDAGVREIDIQPELHDELVAWKQTTRHSEQGDLVFPTATGKANNRNNVRRRVLMRAVHRANERIAQEGGCEPLPDPLSPHALRRTFASWLVAEGEDAAYVMGELGHTDPTMTLALYARALKSKRRRPHATRTRASNGNGHPLGTSPLSLSPMEQSRDGIRGAESAS